MEGRHTLRNLSLVDGRSVTLQSHRGEEREKSEEYFKSYHFEVELVVMKELEVSRCISR